MGIKYTIIFLLAYLASYELYIKNQNFDSITLALMFIITYSVFNIYLYLINNMKPIYITKEFDEMAHPVIETKTILHLCNIEKHYGKEFKPKLVEKCNCGSTIFRIYNEDTPKGTYIQFICVKCNQKATGLEFNWKK